VQKGALFGKNSPKCVSGRGPAGELTMLLSHPSRLDRGCPLPIPYSIFNFGGFPRIYFCRTLPVVTLMTYCIPLVMSSCTTSWTPMNFRGLLYWWSPGTVNYHFLSSLTASWSCTDWNASTFYSVSSWHFLNCFQYLLTSWDELSVHYRIRFKVPTLTYNVLAACPPYCLYNLLQLHQPSPALRSSTQHLLQVPYMSTDFGRHAFIYSSPAKWNSIPISIKNCCL